ncbi:hypothetical protein Xszus_00687 [Xenorhabdus szentirmaii]|nr:hypothetical protein Xszus_00687 [Xenorhabdus szentirmaii]
MQNGAVNLNRDVIHPDLLLKNHSIKLNSVI